MASNPLQEVHYLYELEKRYLESIITEDPTVQKYKSLMDAYDRMIGEKLGQETFSHYRMIRANFQALLKEMMFKMGYLFAKGYPLDEAAGIRDLE